MYAVIMAGGRGTRFWPLSREQRPKHLLAITGEKSLIRLTVERILPLVPREKIIIVTAAAHAEAVVRELPEIPGENILIEPAGKNTAPCIALASFHIRKRGGDDSMIVLPSDHVVTDEERFRSVVSTALHMATRGPRLVTIGITPTRPDTGFGYIEKGALAEDGTPPVFKALSIREKPDRQTAERFLREGTFLWNSGMFIWRVSTVLDALARFLPDTYEKMAAVADVLGTDREKEALAAAYAGVQSISIDYGVMEKADNVYVVEGDFGWSDVGSWDSLWEISAKDCNGIAAGGTVIAVDSSNSLIMSGKEKVVALVGVDDLIIVESHDALLICRRGDSQKVKDVVDELERKNLRDLL
ncbi:MAG: mannose-1-phosphate guanylyltransferase [Deltaproteobacteria bacterium]|nr:mannose-1-phosphate guanylyltransferase [Deltaproteobacteria bacterium]